MPKLRKPEATGARGARAQRTEKALRHVRDRLSLLIQTSGRPLYSLEEELGFASSSLSKTLNGALRLKMSDVLLILDALDVNPAAFFRWVFSGDNRASPLIERLRGSEAILLNEHTEDDASALDRRIAKVVERMLEEERRKSQGGES